MQHPALASREREAHPDPTFTRPKGMGGTPFLGADGTPALLALLKLHVPLHEAIWLRGLRRSASALVMPDQRQGQLLPTLVSAHALEVRDAGDGVVCIALAHGQGGSKNPLVAVLRAPHLDDAVGPQGQPVRVIHCIELGAVHLKHLRLLHGVLEHDLVPLPVHPEEGALHHRM